MKKTSGVLLKTLPATNLALVMVASGAIGALVAVVAVAVYLKKRKT